MTVEGAIAVNRFGLGARPGELAVASADPRGWLRDQLSPQHSADFRRENLSGSRDMLRAQLDHRQQQARLKASGDQARAMQSARDFPKRGRQAVLAEIRARTLFGVNTEASFQERLVRFWSNHFTISGTNRQVLFIAGPYEREAIRPHILGRFEDLARAAIFHPAMLIYLDNVRSIGPRSDRGRGRRRLGLNENLAREVMELHTVTPASGYSQSDVTEFARALTGWTVGGLPLSRERPGEAYFQPGFHEPGGRRVLGQSYRADTSDQALTILRDFCAHPATARNIAFKLARHVAADDPPEVLVARLSDVFLRTDGDLTALYLALIDAPEAWAAEAAKLKTPDELITSAARMLGPQTALRGNLARAYDGFGQRPFLAPSPEGWPDTSDAWLGPDAILKRLEWANRLAGKASKKDARGLLEDVLGPRLSPETARAIAGAESGEQAIALALMSPDFQKR